MTKRFGHNAVAFPLRFYADGINSGSTGEFHPACLVPGALRPEEALTMGSHEPCAMLPVIKRIPGASKAE